MTKLDTNFFFAPKKLSIILDGGAGSSGKGTLGSFVCEHANNFQFVCNTFYPQAGHWVKLDDGRTYFYQTLNSCAYLDKYEKMYIGPGSIMELPAFFREMEENNVKPNKIGIHPLVAILQDNDTQFERGKVNFEGNPIIFRNAMKYGTTAHGVGACRARRILRRPELICAKDVPKLQKFLCNTSAEIMQRLDGGQAGLLEIAQGFQLSIGLEEFFPYTTSRNCTVAAGLDDMMLPPIYAGNVMLNFRTYPIRIHNKKYLDPDTKKHLIWDEIQEYKKAGKEIEIQNSPSGSGYNDQEEITWEQVANQSGSPESIMEWTSVTKLPRRIYTWSKKNLLQAIQHNRTAHQTYLSINFVNYLDHKISGERNPAKITEKVKCWLKDNVTQPIIDAQLQDNITLKFLGTGPLTDDKLILP